MSQGGAQADGPECRNELAERKARWKGTVALLLGATAIGLAPVLVRLSEVGPAMMACYRVGLALPLLWLALWREGSPSHGKLRSDAGWLALAGTCFAIDLTLWHWSIQWTTVANATLFANFTPIFVVIGAAWLLHERIRPNLVAGLAVALAGGAMLGAESFRLDRGHLKGDAVAVCAAVFYAGYLLVVKRLRRDCSTAVIMAGSGVVSTPLFWLAGAAAGEKLVPATGTGWLTVGALAIVSHVAGQGLIAYGMAAVPASFSSVALLWQAVVAAGLAALMLGEGLSPLRLLGAAIVLAGILLASRSAGPARRSGSSPGAPG